MFFFFFATFCRLQFKAGALPIESAEDLVKREKRSFEFSTRISRNYLYQLGRQVAINRFIILLLTKAER